MKQTVLVTGANGQLGRELALTAGSSIHCLALDRRELDIGDAAAVSDLLLELQPQLVINAAAYTVLDSAEITALRATEVYLELYRVKRWLR